MATGQPHRLALERPIRLAFALKDEAGAPYAEKKFALSAGGTTVEGRTATDGFIARTVPAGTAAATIRLWTDDARPGESVAWEWTPGAGPTPTPTRP